MEKKTKMEEDRISFLPDEILHQIFSSIDTQMAIKTTYILSKRWKNFWASIPTLTFHYPSFTCHHFNPSFSSHHSHFRQKRFRLFIKRVLSHRRMHNPHSKVKKLSLCFVNRQLGFRHWTQELPDAQKFEFQDKMVFKHVFHFAALSGVEELCVDGGYADLSDWCRQFSTCRSLKLSGYFDTQWVPHSFQFLKFLEIGNYYKQHYFELEGGVLPTYPVLERLILRGPCFDRVTINAPKLEYLELDNIIGYDLLDLEFLLFAPKLASVKLDDFVPSLICSHDFPSLCKVDFSISCVSYGFGELKKLFGERIKGLLNLLQKANSLTLNAVVVKVLSDFIVPSPSLFEKLRHLTLNAGYTDITDSNLMLRCLLDNPRLEECHIDENWKIS